MTKKRGLDRSPLPRSAAATAGRRGGSESISAAAPTLPPGYIIQYVPPTPVPAPAVAPSTIWPSAVPHTTVSTSTSSTPSAASAPATPSAAEGFYDRGSSKNSQGLSLEELHTSPESQFQRKSNCIAMKNPMAQVYKNMIFRNKIGIPTIFLGTPSFRTQFSGNVLPLS